MARTIPCPACGEAISIPDGFVGNQARCPRCREVIPVSEVTGPWAPADFASAPEGGAVDAQAVVASASGTSGKAIASLVLGVMSLCIWLFGSIPAIVLGILSLRDIQRSGGRLGGSAMAIIGIIAGAIGTVTIVPILVALLLPAVNKARDAARRVESSNKLKIMALAGNTFEANYGHFPPAGMSDQGETANLSWRVYILPELGEQALFNEFHLDEPWDSPHNMSLIPRMPAAFRHPHASVLDGETVYLAVTGPGTPFQGPRQGSTSYQDSGPTLEEIETTFRGAAKTVMFVEVDYDYSVIWTQPDAEYYFDASVPWVDIGGNWPGGFYVAYVDGSVEFISQQSTSDVQLQEIFQSP